MTQEDRQLLLKDICARLPYELKVKCEKYPFPVTVLYAGNINEVKFVETGGIEPIGAVKPFLRPMSSMTEEEETQYRKTQDKISVQWDDYGQSIGYVYASTIKTYDWLNENHFDYRGLIPMGLALVAPTDMYKK